MINQVFCLAKNMQPRNILRQIQDNMTFVIRSYLGKIGFLAFISILIVPKSLSQTLMSVDSSYSDNIGSNLIEYGVDKIVNTYAFKGNANLYMKYDWGNIFFKQNYLGKAIRSGNNSFWDDEFFIFGIDKKVTENLFFTAKQNVSYYSSDIKTQGISKISQSRSTGGVKYIQPKNFSVETNAGYELNEQGSIKGEGAIFNIGSDINNYELEKYFLSANALVEYISLNDGREKSILDIKGNLSRKFDESNSLRIDARYKSFLYPVALSDVGENSIKNRLENNLYFNLYFNFGLSESIFGSIGIVADDKDVSHSYNKYYEGYDRTAVETKRNELNLNFTSELSYISDNFFQSFGMSYLPKNENNSIEKIFEIDDDDFNDLQREEKKLDNISSTTQLKGRTVYLFANKDSLSAHFLISLYSYDTPSEEINDDRDELANLVDIRYTHTFSKSLSVSLESEVQMIHYVYIKSQRSANNNWYRAFKLSPSVRISTKKLNMNPVFYISANYYAYDFEDLSPNIDSYSIREIGFRDSVFIYLTSDINLQLRYKIRYYEDGTLFWDNFSETPKSSNYEHFVKILFFFQPYENLSLGCGLRFFELRQKNLGIYAFNNNGIEHNSFAPESVISYKVTSDIYVDLRAWYEFQKTNRDINYKEIPNLLMVTKINI
ncbi:MAG: hypothetical protein V1779_12070 [bacterium]